MTLEWDAEDVAKVFVSQFMGKDIAPCDDISGVADGALTDPFVISKVIKDGSMIGVASGRLKDFYHPEDDFPCVLLTGNMQMKVKN